MTARQPITFEEKSEGGGLYGLLEAVRRWTESEKRGGAKGEGSCGKVPAPEQQKRLVARFRDISGLGLKELECNVPLRYGRASSRQSGPLMHSGGAPFSDRPKAHFCH